MEFHISRRARDLYKFDHSLFQLSGNVILGDLHATRLFTQKINEKKDLIRFPEMAVRAGDLNAMGLIDEILHFIVALYRQQEKPLVMGEVLSWMETKIGKEALDIALNRFLTEFPPIEVYQRKIDASEYFQGDTNGIPNRQLIFEELLLLWLANSNPAFSPFLELFDDAEIEKQTAYSRIFQLLPDYFEEQPRFGPDNQNLIEMLRSPVKEQPHSLSGQLDYIRKRWGYLLGELLFRLLRGMDVLAEESKARFLGPGLIPVSDFRGLEVEAEQFSPDKDWMPSTVLIAKNIYVWLDQLTKKYRREIHKLDQIPDEELDCLARWGFNGLWLIGLWERSAASKRIKQLRGNPDAVASAYSVFDYNIAGDLGGEEAYQNLRDRAWQRGIRLASDMVPNHMGIDSRWVIEHPDWFISLDYSPFPSYTFNGENLSWDPRVGIYLEDHYYDGSDAAVVFKRVDNWTGDTRYIYHGNDGTSMPWNDTAQLNYLKPEVREAVIQTILDVARRSPIIRFDAAMTLAKKHYQRLWFPEPGTGGAIPSRSEHGLSKGEFDRLFPVEFWREVVDRVAQEVPDTLLLAEAFWLMEGFFVRTLGMHRVYNSAFMNMLRDEKNQEYRLVIKNTLVFDPEILKRYVNFMNNPDERTAVDQYGKGDKYFGICIMMATMPGLPMFGHGQIEGFAEKYGMEFRRAYWDEQPDGYLVERHEREIFPLLRKRYLFSEVKNFLLYDFYTPDGQVNEDVFAYSNRSGDECALVVYNNRYADTRGWVRSSAAFAVKSGHQGDKRLEISTLAYGLGLKHESDTYCLFRDLVSGMEYIRSNHQLEEEGLFVELRAYQYAVYSDFRQVKDDPARRHYAQLAEYLNGRGVPNIDEALKEIIFQPVLTPFRDLVSAEMLNRIIESRRTRAETGFVGELMLEVERKVSNLLREVNNFTGTSREGTALENIVSEVRTDVEVILHLDKQIRLIGNRKGSRRLEKFLNDRTIPDLAFYAVLLGWVFTRSLGKAVSEQGSQMRSRSWLDEWLLSRALANSFRELGMSEELAWRTIDMIKALLAIEDSLEFDLGERGSALQAVKSWLVNDDVQRVLGINRFQGILWYNNENYNQFLKLVFAAGIVRYLVDMSGNKVEQARRTRAIINVFSDLVAAAEKSDFQVEKLLEFLEGENTI
jgi:hypothetical protein